MAKGSLGINQGDNKSLSTCKAGGRQDLGQKVNREGMGAAGSSVPRTGRPLRTTNERRSECSPGSAFRHLRGQSPLARTSQARDANPAGRKAFPNPGAVIGVSRTRGKPANAPRKTLARYGCWLRTRTEYRRQQTPRSADRLRPESPVR